jgi:hypothetical protein
LRLILFLSSFSIVYCQDEKNGHGNIYRQNVLLRGIRNGAELAHLLLLRLIELVLQIQKRRTIKRSADQKQGSKNVPVSTWIAIHLASLTAKTTGMSMCIHIESLQFRSAQCSLQ